MKIFRELRLGLTTIGGVIVVTDETTIPFVCTGQADVIAISDDGTRGFVIDTKTGRGEYEHATGNAQLRTLAVLVAKRWRLESVRVAIVQPWAGKPTVADYDYASLAASAAWLGGVLHRVNGATPDNLNAGDWCHYCKAKATCPKLQEKALAPIDRMTMQLPADDKTARAALFARAMECDADTLAGLYKGLRLVGWWVAAIEGAAKTRAKDDVEFQRYFRLKPGVVREKIVDVQTVFTRVNALGVPAAEFTAECDLTKSALESMVRKATGLKGRDLKAQIETILNGATESKETAPQLEEVEL